jgi:hypothetical protein
VNAVEVAERKLCRLGLLRKPMIEYGCTDEGKRVIEPVLRAVAADTDFFYAAQAERDDDKRISMLDDFIYELRPQQAGYDLSPLEWTVLLIVPFIESLNMLDRIDFGEAIATRRMVTG